jgi:hypothetical protein
VEGAVAEAGAVEGAVAEVGAVEGAVAGAASAGAVERAAVHWALPLRAGRPG